VELWPSMDEELRQLFYLPYESTSTLADRLGIQLPPLELSPETGTAVTVLDPELKAKLGSALSIPEGIPFFAFNKQHSQAVKDLSKVFIEAKSLNVLKDVAIMVKDHVNSAVFLAALYHTYYERKDLSPGDTPPLPTVLPDRFVPTFIINKAKKLAKSAIINNQTEVVVEWHSDETGLSSRSPEHRVSYWREDMNLNSFHWHWHLSNPYYIEPGDRDRRGELFYYMHHNLVARYNMERLSLNLKPVKAFEDWRIPVQDGYFPHLTTGNGQEWSSRQDSTFFQDIREIPLVDSNYVSQLEMWRTHLYHGIDVGYLIHENGSYVRLTDNPEVGEDYGINLVGEALEAGDSVNPDVYGNIHNLGHDFLGQSHDPAKKHSTTSGVMGAVETAVRDPVFFRWHKFIDNVFHRYKLTQPPYTPRQLSGNITVLNVTVQEEHWIDDYVSPENLLHTFFTPKTFNSSSGIDFRLKRDDNITVHIKSNFLEHPDFSYTITVNNPTSDFKRMKLRIFLAPKFDEEGVKMNYASLLRYWTEVDVFETDPIAPGIAYITRHSNESSILSTSHEGDKKTAFAFSGCSWPRNLQVPRGTQDGMNFHFFVMATDVPLISLTSHEPGTRKSSSSFCGRPDQPIPDPWPMGYPLERRSSKATIEDFVDEHPNMMLQEVTITHLRDPSSVLRRPISERKECLLFTC
uniref:Prophenoloxidase b n=1 Tax=Penaeus japonicus TaxID=27405 RepID=UPI000453B3AA|nr:Chain A, Prophenoloxidase b [Penaeus japonicus]3WKY_B Chain B, Prophenoloxidase b [Penaeus japonicus]